MSIRAGLRAADRLPVCVSGYSHVGQSCRRVSEKDR